MTKRLSRTVWIITLTACAGLLAISCYQLLWSTFMQYDDEGYVLISLRRVLAGHALYDVVFSQYGPAFYFVYGGIARVFGLVWTNTSARELTFFHWAAVALLCADIVRRKTHSLAVTALTLTAVVAFLWVMVSEPGHPGGAIAFFVALAAWLGVVKKPLHSTTTAVALGVIAGILFLTKINVGLFLLISAAVWFGAHLPRARSRQIVLLLFSIGAAVLPWLLMRSLLPAPWVVTFAWVTSVAGFGVVATLQNLDSTGVSFSRALIGFMAGAAGAGLCVIVATLAHGTTLASLLEGVVFSPLRHPSVYSLAPNWQPGTRWVAGGSLVLTLWRLNRPQDKFPSLAVAGLRIAAAGATLLCLTQALPLSLAAFVMSYGLGLVPVLMVREPTASSASATVIPWLGTLLIWQSLHAYPVAGSQLNWGTFLWIPLVLMSARESWLGGAARVPASLYRPVTLAGVFVCFAVTLTIGVTRMKQGRRNFAMGRELGLPGAEKLMLSPDYVAIARAVAKNAEIHAGLLFSLPGMFSLNQWTGKPTPDDQNVTHWFSILSLAQQENISTRVLEDPRAVCIVHRSLLRYLTENGYFQGGQLSSTLAQNFHQAFQIGEYGFWVRNGRDVAALDLGTIGRDANVSSQLLLNLCVSQPQVVPHSITLSSVIGGTPVVQAVFGGGDGPLATPIGLNGHEDGPAQIIAWDQYLPEMSAVRLRVAMTAKNFTFAPLLATGKDERGRTLWEIPVNFQ